MTIFLDRRIVIFYRSENYKRLTVSKIKWIITSELTNDNRTFLDSKFIYVGYKIFEEEIEFNIEYYFENVIENKYSEIINKRSTLPSIKFIYKEKLKKFEINL